MSELTRLSSHQLWWGVMGMDLGAITSFLYGFRDREMITDIFEETCGARLTMNYNVPGGVMFDIPDNFQTKVKEFITHFKKKLPEYDDLLSNNVIFRARTEGVGILSKENAISYGVTGPSGRASGFSCDIRKKIRIALMTELTLKKFYIQMVIVLQDIKRVLMKCGNLCLLLNN